MYANDDNFLSHNKVYQAQGIMRFLAGQDVFCWLDGSHVIVVSGDFNVRNCIILNTVGLSTVISLFKHLRIPA